MQDFRRSLFTLNESFKHETELNNVIMDWLHETENEIEHSCISLLETVPEVLNPENLFEQADYSNSMIWKAIYSNLRAGRRDSLIKLCKSTGHYWKAAILLSGNIKPNLVQLLISNTKNSSISVVLGWLSKTFHIMRLESWQDVLYNQIHCTLNFDVSKKWFQSNMSKWISDNRMSAMDKVYMYLCWIILVTRLPDTSETIQYIISLLMDCIIDPDFDVINILFFFFVDLGYYHELEGFKDKIYVFLLSIISTFALTLTDNIEQVIEWINSLSNMKRNDKITLKLLGTLLMTLYKQKFLDIGIHCYSQHEASQWTQIVNIISQKTGYSVNQILKEWTDNTLSHFITSLEPLLQSIALLEPFSSNEFFMNHIFDILETSFSTMINHSCTQEQAFHINNLVIKHVMQLNSELILSLSASLLKLWQDYSRLCNVYVYLERYSKSGNIDTLLLNAIKEIIDDQTWLLEKDFRKNYLTLLNNKLKTLTRS